MGKLGWIGCAVKDREEGIGGIHLEKTKLESERQNFVQPPVYERRRVQAAGVGEGRAEEIM